MKVRRKLVFTTGIVLCLVLICSFLLWQQPSPLERLRTFQIQRSRSPELSREDFTKQRLRGRDSDFSKSTTDRAPSASPMDEGMKNQQVQASPLVSNLWTEVPENQSDLPLKSIWIPLSEPGVAMSSIAAATDGQAIFLAARGIDSKIYVRKWDASEPQSNWDEIPGDAVTTSQPAIVFDGLRQLRVYIQGSDNQVWVNIKAGSQWSGWFRDGVVTAHSGPEAVLVGGQVHLFVRGVDDQMYTKVADQAVNWKPLPVPGATLNSLAAASDGVSIFMVVRGADERVYFNTRLEKGDYTGWSEVLVGMNAKSQPTIVVDDHRRIRVYVQGEQDHVWLNQKTAGEAGAPWLGWKPEVNFGTSNGPKALFFQGSVYLFVVGPEKQILSKVDPL